MWSSQDICKKYKAFQYTDARRPSGGDHHVCSSAPDYLNSADCNQTQSECDEATKREARFLCF